MLRPAFNWLHVAACRGRWCSWGFPDVANVTKAVVTAPAPNTYIAALRGYEGKPLPPSLGGFKKRWVNRQERYDAVVMLAFFKPAICSSRVDCLRTVLSCGETAAAHILSAVLGSYQPAVVCWAETGLSGTCHVTAAALWLQELLGT